MLVRCGAYNFVVLHVLFSPTNETVKGSCGRENDMRKQIYNWNVIVIYSN